MQKLLVMLNRDELEAEGCKVIGDISKPILISVKGKVGRLNKLVEPLEQVTIFRKPLEELYEDEFVILMEK